MDLTWEDVLNMDLIGCDIESSENGQVFRGPIKEVKSDEERIVFITSWTAILNFDVWKVHDSINEISVNRDKIKPQDRGDGKVMWKFPALGHFVIFPKEVSKLNPKRVEGLDIEALED